MANKQLFQSSSGPLAPRADAVNEAGGLAYQLDDCAALAQYAATGCLNATFYASAEMQLAEILRLAAKVPTDFIARTALYCRQKGFMKDVPALLCAVLASRDRERLEIIFPRVIDNARMLRNFVQVIRSGVTGRKSLGSLPKRLVRQWLDAQTDEALFCADVGQSPSLADIVKMVHPAPRHASRAALYAYLIDRNYDAAALPDLVRKFESWKQNPEGATPNVPFQMLTAQSLSAEQWKAIARRAPWQMTRMNLNTFARHGVFEDKEMVRIVANRLRNPEAVKRARVFPYQLMMAYQAAAKEMPKLIREALQDAMEIAIDNVPDVPGQVYVCVDVSGSMHSSATGYRKGATSAVRCIDIAALVAAAILRKNRHAEVLPFHDNVTTVELNPRDSVMTNAQKLASLPAGGTNCSAPLKELNRRRASGDLVIYVSDNESWMDTPYHGRYSGRTATMEEWTIFRRRNSKAQLICMDIQPYATTQAPNREDILNMGGFSDSVFDLIATVARGEMRPSHWTKEINQVQL